MDYLEFGEGLSYLIERVDVAALGISIQMLAFSRKSPMSGAPEFLDAPAPKMNTDLLITSIRTFFGCGPV